jgi:hypothetical protein
VFKNKEEKELFKQAYGRPIGSAFGVYAGGSIPLEPYEQIKLTCYEKGLSLHPVRSMFSHKNDVYLPFDRVRSVEFRTEEQVSKDVTLTRLLFAGLLAFGLKKKRVNRAQYLVVGYVDGNNNEQQCVLKIDNRRYFPIVKTIIDARNKYLSSQ